MRGRGRMRGDKPGSGIGGSCVCTNPKCSYRVKHVRGEPCNAKRCPKCGTAMTRER